MDWQAIVIGLLVMLALRLVFERVASRVSGTELVTCFRKLHPAAKAPTYAHDTDSGADVYAVENVVLYPGECAKLRTGLAFELPTGYELQVRPKSGLSSQRRCVQLGTVDQGYRGEVLVTMINQDDEDHYEVKVGQKIAQLVIAPVAQTKFVEVRELSETARGEGGFGSSGLT